MINAITKVCTHKIHSKMYPNLFLSGALHTYAYTHEVLDLYYQHEVLLTYMHISIYFACFIYVIYFKFAHLVLSPGPLHILFSPQALPPFLLDTCKIMI